MNGEEPIVERMNGPSSIDLRGLPAPRVTWHGSPGCVNRPAGASPPARRHATRWLRTGENAFRGRFKQTSLITQYYYKDAPAPSKPEQSFAIRVVHLPGGLTGLGDDPCSLTGRIRAFSMVLPCPGCPSPGSHLLELLCNLLQRSGVQEVRRGQPCPSRHADTVNQILQSGDRMSIGIDDNSHTFLARPTAVHRVEVEPVGVGVDFDHRTGPRGRLDHGVEIHRVTVTGEQQPSRGMPSIVTRGFETARIIRAVISSRDIRKWEWTLATT